VTSYRIGTPVGLCCELLMGTSVESGCSQIDRSPRRGYAAGPLWREGLTSGRRIQLQRQVKSRIFKRSRKSVIV
jgi:hypothetical protein